MSHSFTFPPLHTPRWLHNGHVETIYAKSLQSAPPVYRRERLPDSTGLTRTAYDFIDSISPDAPLVVLFHGLEGSSSSHYAVELMRAVQARGWNGVVAHFRGCGGEPNTAPVYYHAGDGAEIGFVLQTLAQRYPIIYTVGVSLGGNAMLNYLGQAGSRAVPAAAASISSPLDLTAAATCFDKGATKLLYTQYFLKSLLPKARQFGGFDEQLAHCKTIRDFDEAFTAPLHGFKNAEAYYAEASSKSLLPNIATPTLLINGRSDPFIPPEALPTEAEVSSAVTLLQPKYGGHAAFVDGSGKGNLQWLPQTVLSYFDQAMHKAV